MKLFERRLRVSKIYLVGAIFYAALVALSLASGSTMVMPGRSHVGRPLIVRAKDPGDFALVVGCYAGFAAVSAFFSKYQFRRGSWFNPIK